MIKVLGQKGAELGYSTRSRSGYDPGMLNAEALIALIFGVLVLSVCTFIGFPVMNQHKRIDAVLGTLWNATPVKIIRRLVVGFVVFLLALYLAVCLYFSWLQWIA